MSVDIEVLAREHDQTVQTIDGTVTARVPALLSQLHEAIYQGSAPDGASAGFKARLPVQAAALDLWRQITAQVDACYRQKLGRPAGHVFGVLSRWAAFVDDDTLVTVNGRDVYARDAVAGWEAQIRAYLDPPRLAEIQAPCIQCGRRWKFRPVDGQIVRSAALVMVRDRDTGRTLYAECQQCGAVWWPGQFAFLAEAIDAETTRV